MTCPEAYFSQCIKLSEREEVMLTDHRAYATIPAADMNRAKTWYSDKLGLTPASEDELGCMYRVGEGSSFLLYPTANAGKAPNTLLSFSTDDLEVEVQDLRRRGVSFEEYDMPGLKTVNGIATMGTFHAAWFKDSEGNILAVGDEAN
jgi:catechol 2,3-dioxygenase-like lactoylglutathione lyase family enzyme